MTITKENIGEFQQLLKDKTANEIIDWAFSYFGTDNIALASSMSIEDQAITHIMLNADKNARIFTIDTGRLPEETHSVMNKTCLQYSFSYELLFPNADKVIDMVSKYGNNLFYDSVENRKLCCNIRKVDLLKKKLSTLKAWITGLRSEQSVTRTDMQVIEWDEGNNIVKLNPIINWTEKETWDYIKKNGIPYNTLYNKGYTSIGCAPCTRAIKEGEDIRAGRWWWENPEQKECGLHSKK
jgi:phosphoadenosine phosphosulfate reductase